MTLENDSLKKIHSLINKGNLHCSMSVAKQTLAIGHCYFVIVVIVAAIIRRICKGKEYIKKKRKRIYTEVSKSIKFLQNLTCCWVKTVTGLL